MSFDYVIVGSGSGGSAVARRLVDAGATVALLEAGARDDNPAIHDPTRWPELPASPQDWALQTVPQEACHGRRLSWPRGHVLGGTSTMNGMAWIRGHRLDYDGWAYHGCPGWTWEEVLPYFKRSEDCDRGASESRGVGGPVHVLTRYEPHPVLRAMADASVEAGIPFNDDHNTGELDGVGFTQLSIRDGRRQTAAVAYLAPIAGHPGLTIMTGTRALRLAFEGSRCVGVEVERDGRTDVVRAATEVVLSAGTIESPRLLLLSGIGPAEELAALGIPSRVALDGVGRNLHDHIIAPVLFSSPVPIPAVRPGLSHHHVHLFARSRGGLPVPDTQPVGFHMPLGMTDWMTPPEHGYTFTPGLVRTQSRGALRLTSADPTAPLSLDPRVLTVAADLDALVSSVELMREVGRQPALAPWTGEEVYPGPAVRSRDELRDYVRRTAASYHHQVGTCRMGQDERAVVDPELRVYGTEGLRVADASIMPFITTGNTNAPAFMIGERAADLLLAAQGAGIVGAAAGAG